MVELKVVRLVFSKVGMLVGLRAENWAVDSVAYLVELLVVM